VKFYLVYVMQLAHELQTSMLLLETGERMMIGLDMRMSVPPAFQTAITDARTVAGNRMLPLISS